MIYGSITGKFPISLMYLVLLLYTTAASDQHIFGFWRLNYSTTAIRMNLATFKQGLI
jgi:hypothetical protein